MNREEILTQSRRENQRGDEMAKQTFTKAGQLACAVGGLMCTLIIVLETFFAEEYNLGIWAIYLSMTATMLLAKYKSFKKKSELAAGLILLVLAVVFLVADVVRLSKVAYG